MSEIPLSVKDAASKLRSGEMASVELTTAVFARADAVDAQIGAYLARFDEPALAGAERADKDVPRHSRWCERHPGRK
jgi:aspartyl-tRNA(Asn)/glutamyl-tRNA(Gln) amidotransferase subunit A